jgi:hypothetical protein
LEQARGPKSISHRMQLTGEVTEAACRRRPTRKYLGKSISTFDSEIGYDANEEAWPKPKQRARNEEDSQ